MAGSDFSNELYDEVFIDARKLGIDRARADDLARMVDDGMRRRLGGQSAYVQTQSKDSRDADMLRDWMNSVSVPELMRRYDLSRPQVYARLKLMRS